MKLQSAMEYLMTYGWAILIIAIVIIALFKLNVFNPNYWSPKLQPGSCSVIRKSYGSASLSSGCLINAFPEYTVSFAQESSTVNSAIQATINQFSTSQITLTFWAKNVQCKSANACTYLHISTSDSCSGYNGLWITQAQSNLCTSSGSTSLSYVYPYNVWTFYAITISPNLATPYVNGVAGTTSSTVGNIDSITSIVLGDYAYPGSDNWDAYDGYLANVQVYNTSLSANSIQALYLEGIGGAPIKLQNLVGWWPLNDNANDYSGNGYNGAASSVFYTSGWESGYTVP